jgi:hypothetical protein
MNILTRIFCIVLLAGGLFSGCTPTAYKVGIRSVEPSLIGNKLIVADGAKLPIRKWGPKKGN